MAAFNAQQTSNLKVIIVGGSVAGLTLAHCLAKANIDHIVLEKRAEISPQEGAFIGIWPNGAQVLDQLGLYAALESLTVPIHKMHIRFPDGFTFSSMLPRDIEERFGYPIISLDRQKVLETLHARYPRKSNVLVNKKVTSVCPYGTGISVVTEDGSIYDGDLVVGADGIHSKVRAEMWRLADARRPGLITRRDKEAFTVEYVCVFGISEHLSTLQAGEHINSYSEGLSVITFHGKEGRVFWFLLAKLPQLSTYPNTPRFSASDAAAFCHRFAGFRVSEDICVSDLWKNKTSSSITALEEGILQTWHFDRIVLLGDSIHKMTPNIGQGANTAVEDAAVLASLIRKLSQLGPKARQATLTMTTMLEEFQSVRYDRVKSTYEKSRFGARLHTRDGLVKTLIGRYIFPYAGRHVLDRSAKSLAGAHSIQFLPPPERLGIAWRENSRQTGSSFGSVLVYISILVPCLVYLLHGRRTLDPVSI
ncbi:hypothetical protein BJX70DRAFT_377411 [Aspergillus crustosus]